MIHIQGAAADKPRRPLHSKNKKWVAGQADMNNGPSGDGEKWERGTDRRRGRGRGAHTQHGTHLSVPTDPHDGTSATEDEGASGDSGHEEEEEPVQPEPETPEEREKFYHELVKQREAERKRAIAEGKMDDPLVPKRLDEAITMVGTCMDMCPRFERYRRERENNLDKWEVIPGTKRVDHKRAVKIYERAAGDKTIPSDLRPPAVLKKTLNYLFHDLLIRGGFLQTYDFIRDRSRAVRNDFTMQHETGPLAMECHDRCARFHILALHIARDSPRFSIPLEEQQLMNTLQSLKEFYEDQRGRYQSPTELEMRVYHRLIHIRDQKERHEEIPDDIRNHPVFRLTTEFRLRVQANSAPITKASKLIVDDQAMQIFGQLAAVLREQNNVAMVYLVACIMERLFGKDCIDDIEGIRGDLTIPEVIDGISKSLTDTGDENYTASPATVLEDITEIEEVSPTEPPAPAPLTSSATEWLTNTFGGSSSSATSSQSAFPASSPPIPPSIPSTSAFSNLASRPSAFGGSEFGSSTSSSGSAFGNLTTKASAFGGATFGSTSGSSTSSPFSTKSAFGGSSPSTFGTTSSPSPFAQPTPESSRAPLSSQPTWPAGSSAFANTPSAPSTHPATSVPTPPQAPTLNPFAPTFTPPQSQFTTSSIPSQVTATKPSLGEKPSIFPSNIFNAPLASSSAPVPEPSAPTSGDIFSIPLVPTQPVTPVQNQPPLSEETPREKTPPPSALIERRQTLWDLPGSSSPFSRLKDHRMTFTPQPGNVYEPRTPVSPTAPPPGLGKVPTIALPPTPTQRWFDPSSGSSESDTSLSRKRSLLHFPSLTMSAPMPAEILSPIHLSTPTPEKIAPAGTGGPSPLYQSHVPPAEAEPQAAPAASASTSSAPTVASPIARTPSGPKPILEIQTNGFSSSPTSKGKAKATSADLDFMAEKFLRTGLLVKHHWQKWRKRRETTKAWDAAVRRSDFFSTSVLGPNPDQAQKKRRISVPTEAASAQVRRIKRRKSNQFMQPLTDDALAQRLQENFEENERRWAQGSFRQTILDVLKSRLQPGAELPEWCAWLSVNTENDKTAIWLEHKFDVPASGYWVSENVFSLPAFERPEAQGSPGLIVFERTPLEGVDDEIEKKYRVLDDCARLRDVIGYLPPLDQRHYMPCLLVVNWSETEDSAKTMDLVEMTQKLVRDEVIKHVSYFNVSATAKELDKKFADILNITPLETDDRLCVAFGWKDVRKLFVAPVESTISDMLDSCWPDDEFDWARYDRVVVAIEEILNSALRAILGLFDDTPSHVSVEIPEEIQQPGIMGRGYATGQFTDALARLLLSSAQELIGTRLATPIVLSKEVLDTAVAAVRRTIDTHTEKLRQHAAEAALRASLRPSPKRPASDDDLRCNGSISSKRFRLSPPSDAEDGLGDSGNTERNGLSASPPPSTSGATDTSEKPIVTVAMLRALTRDMLKTYGK
ncbi:SAC3/GANP/Nin1/mts3/eIF-3 p25 family-domain-containing protein [Daedaleopsis nitida]|nr:SAC3/GANP/Nin1/mts3/eIF-3 p25 family-domain-containing protein [Daedaleopsis nitida]